MRRYFPRTLLGFNFKRLSKGGAVAPPQMAELRRRSAKLLNKMIHGDSSRSIIGRMLNESDSR
jgi:hypothetical protein